MLPLGCLPLWGREGVTFLIAAEKRRTMEKSISTEPKQQNQIKIRYLPASADTTIFG
jgi:hypothetical protein